MANNVSYMDPQQTVINGGPEPSSRPATSDADKDIKMAKALMAQGKAARSDVDKDWKKRVDYYNGRQWQGEKFANLYKAKPVLNIIRQTIQQQLPLLTDAKPGFSVLPKDPTDYNFASMLSELVDALWDNQALDHTIVEVLTDEMILDAGILKITWDPDAEDGAGEIKIDICDPFDIFVPYGARDFGKDCPWVIHRSWKPVEELKDKFPKFRDKIKSDSGKSEEETASKRVSDDITLVSPTDQYSPPGMRGTSSDDADQRKVAEVWEVWYKSDELNEAEVDGTVKKKYPKGALCTILPNQNLRLQKVTNPYEHGKWPFVRFVDNILPRQFWGEGESGVLMQTQRMLNRALAHLFDYSNMMSNPVWVIEEDSGLDADKISNQVAAVLMTKPGTAVKNGVRRDFAPAMPPGIIDFYQLILGMSEKVTGTAEVSAGRKPPGVSAAAAIDTLQEAAQSRIRLKERNMQVSLAQMGQQIIALMLQFYTEPRVARITGKSGQWPQYFEFFIEKNPETNQYTFNRKSYNLVHGPTGSGYQASPGYTQSQTTKGVFDVKVLSGTSLPFSKVSRSNIAFRLFDSQALDQKGLLEALEWPNSEEIMTRMKENPPPAEETPPPPAGA